MQPLKHLSLKPVVSPIAILETISPAHVHSEVVYTYVTSKSALATFTFSLRLVLTARCSQCDCGVKWSLGLIKPIYAVSFSKAHVYRDVLGTYMHERGKYLLIVSIGSYSFLTQWPLKAHKYFPINKELVQIAAHWKWESEHKQIWFISFFYPKKTGKDPTSILM